LAPHGDLVPTPQLAGTGNWLTIHHRLIRRRGRRNHAPAILRIPIE
jgi:hypothetical protein